MCEVTNSYLSAITCSLRRLLVLFYSHSPKCPRLFSPHSIKMKADLQHTRTVVINSVPRINHMKLDKAQDRLMEILRMIFLYSSNVYYDKKNKPFFFILWISTTVSTKNNTTPTF